MGGVQILAHPSGDIHRETLAFNPHWDVTLVIVSLGVAYEVGLRRLADRYAPRDEPPVTTRQRVLFYVGLAVLFAAAYWPVHDIAESRLFTFHMIEHVVIALVVPPLLLAGIPWWLLRAVLRPVLPVVKFLTKPLVALLIFNGWLAFIHVPGVVELMLTNDVFHAFAHAMLFVSALIMWWPVMDPIPDTVSLSPFGKMGYLFLQSLVPTIPASFLTFGETPLYPIYESFPRLWGIDVMNDQIIAGFIMKIGGGLILWGFIAWIFFSWYAEEQKYATPPTVISSSP